MDVLLGCAETLNPCVTRLRKALDEHDRVDRVRHDLEVFWAGDPDVDVLHLQWPRALFSNWQDPTEKDLERLRSQLKHWGRTARIVTTIHNIRAHDRSKGSLYDELYRLVYKESDGFIHMGSVSRDLLQDAYSLSEKEETIIPHGWYDTLPDEVSQTQARGELGIPEEAALAVVFGALRSPDEVTLIREGVRRWANPRKRVLIAGRLTWPNHRVHDRVARGYHRLRTLLLPVTFRFGRFADNKIQYFLRAADIFLIPRLRILNSGDVPLGFTFSRVVVGPNEGVVGELLRETGNPTFDPDIPSSVATALQKGYERQQGGLGESNRRYAAREMNWRTVADQHICFYSGA